jgi:hypothetical protein
MCFSNSLLNLLIVKGVFQFKIIPIALGIKIHTYYRSPNIGLNTISSTTVCGAKL